MLTPEVFCFMIKTVMNVDLVNTQAWCTINAFVVRIEIGFRKQMAITVGLVHNIRDMQSVKLECFEYAPFGQDF